MRLVCFVLGHRWTPGTWSHPRSRWHRTCRRCGRANVAPLRWEAGDR